MLELTDYLDLSPSDAAKQWKDILDRSWMPTGVRQVDFVPIETLLCFGLGLVGTRSRSGTINISENAEAVLKLSDLVKRTPSSLAAKLANLDGRRANSAKYERALWAELAEDLLRFEFLYEIIIDTARELGIDQTRLPDFLGLEVLSLHAVMEANRVSTHELRESINDQFNEWQSHHPGGDGRATERVLVGTARVGQYQFARSVLRNSGYSCVFCGLSFRSAGLPTARMLVASHIKPWRHSQDLERVDPSNGLAACPTHDAAFDSLLMTIRPDLSIELSPSLQAAMRADPLVARNFGPAGLRERLLNLVDIPPGNEYITWHRNATELAGRHFAG